ncbi:MAG: hypothetical protein JXA42_23440, partial [Anaerolineales bacterium]|nr:hypothetical protein [Anaerolineales bacterium]
SAWCNRCTTQFTVRSTSGDFGFVVDARWSKYSYLSARYIMPRCDSLYLCLVLKDSQDPRDMIHDPEGACWSAAREGKCRPGAPWLTGADMGLRPGLHQCMVGTLYDWKLLGRIPTPEELGEGCWMGWEIDGQWWPGCATERALWVEKEDRRRLEQSAGRLQGNNNIMPDDLYGQYARIGRKTPMLYRAYLPPMSALREGEYYLLHHWLTAEMKQYRELQVWPDWYVVRPVTDEHGRIEEWDIVRRDICPQCSRPVMPEDLAEEGEGLDIPHSFCRDVWERTGWRPQFNEARVGE